MPRDGEVLIENESQKQLKSSMKVIFFSLAENKVGLLGSQIGESYPILRSQNDDEEVD